MSIKQKLKARPRLYEGILTVLNALDYFAIRFRLLFPSYKLTDNWKK